MSLAAGCPRCPSSVVRTGTDGGWRCAEHGEVEPLWRPPRAEYDLFVDHLDRAEGFPTFLPWPVPPGWRLTDFGVVSFDSPGARPHATLSTVSGTSQVDGPVEVLIVAEEPGVGLGERVAGVSEPTLPHVRPEARVRIGNQWVPLWSLPCTDHGEAWERAVVVGESHGRWLWLITRPASAMLMLTDDLVLRDAAELGMALVELPFGDGPMS